MTNAELIQRAKDGEMILSNWKNGYLMERASCQVAAALSLVRHISDMCFQDLRLCGLYDPKDENRAEIALKWMDANYDTVLHSLTAACELLDDACTNLIDKAEVKTL